MSSVIVTGATGGLGRMLCEILARRGNRVIAVGRQPEKLLDPLPDFDGRRESGLWVPVCGDLSSAFTLERIESEAARFGVATLFNVAGVHSQEPFERQSEASTLEVIATNLVAVIQLTRRIYPLLRRKGTIVNVNSIAAKDGGHEETAYVAAKAGLAGFSRSLRLEARVAGIAILDIYLGAMKTDMMRDRIDYRLLIDAAEAASLILDLTASRETLQVEEVTIRRRMYEAAPC